MQETVSPMKTIDLEEQPAEPEQRGGPEKRGRKASKEVRRLQLIEATIDSLAKRGYADTTMADVADGAGLSRGIVNFHFESKEKLLVATLQHMYDEYSAHWRAAYTKAGDDPAAQLRASVRRRFMPPDSVVMRASSRPASPANSSSCGSLAPIESREK